MDDFFQSFNEFYDRAQDVSNVRFSYMKELYNLGVDTFPDNYEIMSIQKQNQASIQQGNTKLKKNWTDDDRKVLIWIIGKYMALYKRDFKSISENDWKTIASMMLRRDAFQCKQKWLQMLKLPLQQAPWNQNEDEALVTIITQFQAQNKGNKWSQIATALNKHTNLNVHRNGKQCRERWNNHLNPSINRNPWQLPEDLELMKLAIQNGKKWALISKKLKLQRSENNVKNRFNCLMRKEKSNKHHQADDESDYDNEDSYLSEPSAEELSQQDVKLIQSIIKKIEWRMKQDGTMVEIKQEDHQPQPQKKVQTERRVLKFREQPQPQQQQQQQQQQQPQVNNINININTINHSPQMQNPVMTFQILDFSVIEDISQFSICFINKDKNALIFPTSEQLNQFFQKQVQSQFLLPQIQNALNSITQDNQQLNIQENNIQQQEMNLNHYYSVYSSNFYNQQQQQQQRSILNVPLHPSPSQYQFNYTAQQYQQYQPSYTAFHQFCYDQGVPCLPQQSMLQDHQKL